ncbi:MAG: zf-HC2 domain-containing protein [Armatimonadota bacterium]
MNCRQAKKLIPLDADKEIKEDLHFILQAHLAECESCSDAYSAYKSSIDGLERSLHTITDGITASDSFTTAVAGEAAAIDARYRAKYRFISGFASRIFDSFNRSRWLAAFASIAIIIAVTIVIGNAATSVLNTTPVASTKVNPGRFIVFTVHPTTDGKIVAGVDSRGYCQITRSKEEALR